MIRLIESDDLGNWGVKGLPWKNLYKGQVINDITHEKLYLCLFRLMEYESTGLAPYEIEEMLDKGCENCPHFMGIRCSDGCIRDIPFT